MAESRRRKRGASSLPIAGPKCGKNGVVKTLRVAALQTWGTQRVVMRAYGCMLMMIGGVLVGCGRYEMVKLVLECVVEDLLMRTVVFRDYLSFLE